MTRALTRITLLGACFWAAASFLRAGEQRRRDAGAPGARPLDVWEGEGGGVPQPGAHAPRAPTEAQTAPGPEATAPESPASGTAAGTADSDTATPRA